MIRIRCVFRPQAWGKGVASDALYEVEPHGDETTWEMEVEKLPKENSYESDELRFDPAAPAWCKDWRGPFEVDFFELS